MVQKEVQYLVYALALRAEATSYASIKPTRAYSSVYLISSSTISTPSLNYI